MDEQGWRQAPDDAEVFFGNQKKTVALENRRPVIRKPSDLVGPGIAATAVRITDFNDLLATYNGYFAAEIGTFGAPNTTDPFVGITANDASLGGFQMFTSLTSGEVYKRVFQRNPADASSILWNSWVDTSNVLIGEIKGWPTNVAPTDHLICDGSTFSSTTYPTLASLLGGTTLPDLRDRTIYGVGTNWSLMGNDGLAVADRTKNLWHEHILVVDAGGAHFHLLTADGDHNHGGNTSTPVGGTLGRADGAGTVSTPSHTHNITTGGSHNHGGFTQGSSTHSHTAETNDPSSDGPKLRGLGLNWIIRAR